jgi:hypothetical protein
MAMSPASAARISRKVPQSLWCICHTKSAKRKMISTVSELIDFMASSRQNRKDCISKIQFNSKVSEKPDVMH